MIEAKRGITTWSPLRWVALAVLGVAVATLAYLVLDRNGGSRLRIDSERLATAVVQRAQFLDYYPFDGTVEPATSVFLDIEGGGRVERIYVEGGARVEKGDLILTFSNTQLRKQAIDTETQLLYNLDIQRTTLFNRQQSTLLLKDTLLELDHQILELQKKYDRFEKLMRTDDSPVSQEVYETTRDQLKFLKDRRVLLAERIRQEDELSAKQLAQANRAIEKLNTGLGMVSAIVESLDVRAPISGYLSTIDAQIGQNIPAGKRIGQLDLLDRFKVRVKIDQYYISRVEIGTQGHVNLDEKTWPVTVQKIYPEVTGGSFEADVTFDAGDPPGIKRGQTLTVELTFGAPSTSLVVARGGFYQQSGGRFVYLVSADGRHATRTGVRLGRQNPRQVEVLEGLREGDSIITSSYEAFGEAAELRFDAAIRPAGKSPKEKR